MKTPNPKNSRILLHGRILALGFFLLSCKENNIFYEIRNKRLEKIYGTKNILLEIRRLQADLEKVHKDVQKLYEKIGQKASLHRQLALLFAQSGAFTQCLEHIRLAERYGSIDGELRQLEGLCFGNLSSQKGWEINLARQAEKAYLSALELNPNLYDAKLELAIVYYYGILPKEFESDKKDFYLNEIKRLLNEYRLNMPDDPRSYQLMAQVYVLQNNFTLAKKELILALDTIKKNEPKTYLENPQYQEIKNNLEKLP